jgi:hypothetical protein
MPEQKDFVLPQQTNAEQTVVDTGSHPVHERMEGKEILVGAAIVIVGALMFFFLSRWFSDHMVRRRGSPTTARRAGWSLFFFLTFTTAMLVFGFLGGLWNNLFFVIPMAVFVIVALVMFIVSAASSR